MSNEVKETTAALVEALRELYNADLFAFNMQLAWRIAGDSNKQIRANIMEFLTGKPCPKSKAGLTAVSIQLKAYFEQPTLF